MRQKADKSNGFQGRLKFLSFSQIEANTDNQQ